MQKRKKEAKKKKKHGHVSPQLNGTSGPSAPANLNGSASFDELQRYSNSISRSVQFVLSFVMGTGSFDDDNRSIFNTRNAIGYTRLPQLALKDANL